MQARPISVLLSARQIHARVETLAGEIAAALPPDPFIVSLLRGSFVFTADLIRALHGRGMRPQIDFLTLGSYGQGDRSSGTVTLHRALTDEVTGRDVLLVDDILESGRTLHFARELIVGLGAKSVRVCVLLEKPGKNGTNVKADFVGFQIPDKFVVGYGLDYANYYRELPFIGVVDQVE